MVVTVICTFCWRSAVARLWRYSERRERRITGFSKPDWKCSHICHLLFSKNKTISEGKEKC